MSEQNAQPRQRLIVWNGQLINDMTREEIVDLLSWFAQDYAARYGVHLATAADVAANPRAYIFDKPPRHIAPRFGL